MIYKALPDHLHTSADRVAEYLKSARSVTNVEAECPIAKNQVKVDLNYRPTLQGISSEKYIIAVEVLDSPDTTTLDPIILECVTGAIPMKLYVAFPTPTTALSHQLVERAHKRGIGVIEITPNGPQVLREALSLSLLGYRLDLGRFPRRLRNTLVEAGNTFRDGSAAKGCSILYDEIEDISRKIIKATKKKKLWRKLKPGEKMNKLNLDEGPWEKVIELFQSFYVVNKKKVPDLTANLIHRVASITSYRNESGHKPKTLEARVKRDQELRTRFESAGDLLFDLIQIRSCL